MLTEIDIKKKNEKRLHNKNAQWIVSFLFITSFRPINEDLREKRCQLNKTVDAFSINIHTIAIWEQINEKAKLEEEERKTKNERRNDKP